jgi:hypothetical protein
VNIELLELAADRLDDLSAEVVFLGGATVGLWITDPAAPPTRTTKDVDVVVEITSRLQFNAFEGKLRDHGFAEDQMDGVICRWRHRDSGLILDAMPEQADILGFDNRWQAAAIPHALQYVLPNEREIRVASPVYLLATKLEAFASRGRGDMLGSRDFGDVVTLVDGREELTTEVKAAAVDVRNFIATGIAQLLELPRLNDGLSGAVPPDAASQDRVDLIIRPRLAELKKAGDHPGGAASTSI